MSDKQKKKKIVLFGAGSYVMLYDILLEFLDFELYAYVDNDVNKHGKLLHGYQIMAPDILYHFDGDIVISCPFEEQIKVQLAEMNIKNPIIDICSLENIKKALSYACQEFASAKQIKMLKNPKSIIFDVMGGTGWGGTEVWSYQMSEMLASPQLDISIYGASEQIRTKSTQEQYVKRFSVNDSKPREIIECMIQDLMQKLPCIIINNFSGYVIFAALVIKHFYPNQVKIISVVHNDMRYLFDKHVIWRDEVNSFFCVSEKIRTELMVQYKIPQNTLFFKESPIVCDTAFKKVYSMSIMPIRIGYGARLDCGQKRADLFPVLIQELERLGILYRLEIAGNGDCYNLIQEYINKHRLEDKVFLLGRLKGEDMPEFWARQDVYLNFSEYEGTSLAMLQAMAYGCVPVVTKVSGVEEFVTENYNGYVCEVGKLDQIALGIARLEKNRTYLMKYGDICREIIRKRCNWNSYMQYWKELLR
ncbi:MAG: glycosyltransferase family 4 protein [Lachnospiraceae bacterium]